MVSNNYKHFTPTLYFKHSPFMKLSTVTRIHLCNPRGDCRALAVSCRWTIEYFRLN